MKIEMTSKKNEIRYFITYKNGDFPSKIITYNGLISDNIIYKKVFLAHNCTFKISKRDLNKNIIRRK